MPIGVGINPEVLPLSVRELVASIMGRRGPETQGFLENVVQGVGGFINPNSTILPEARRRGEQYFMAQTPALKAAIDSGNWDQAEMIRNKLLVGMQQFGFTADQAEGMMGGIGNVIKQNKPEIQKGFQTVQDMIKQGNTYMGMAEQPGLSSQIPFFTGTPTQAEGAVERTARGFMPTALGNFLLGKEAVASTPAPAAQPPTQGTPAQWRFTPAPMSTSEGTLTTPTPTTELPTGPNVVQVPFGPRRMALMEKRQSNIPLVRPEMTLQEADQTIGQIQQLPFISEEQKRLSLNEAIQTRNLILQREQGTSPFTPQGFKPTRFTAGGLTSESPEAAAKIIKLPDGSLYFPPGVSQPPSDTLKMMESMGNVVTRDAEGGLTMAPSKAPLSSQAFQVAKSLMQEYHKIQQQTADLPSVAAFVEGIANDPSHPPVGDAEIIMQYIRIMNAFGRSLGIARMTQAEFNFVQDSISAPQKLDLWLQHATAGRRLLPATRTQMVTIIKKAAEVRQAIAQDVTRSLEQLGTAWQIPPEMWRGAIGGVPGAGSPPVPAGWIDTHKTTPDGQPIYRTPDGKEMLWKD